MTRDEAITKAAAWEIHPALVMAIHEVAGGDRAAVDIYVDPQPDEVGAVYAAAAEYVAAGVFEAPAGPARWWLP